MNEFFKRRMAELLAFDGEKARLECVDKAKAEGEPSMAYPMLSGILQYQINESTSLAKCLYTKLEEVQRRLDAIEIAAETSMDHRVHKAGTKRAYEVLYEQADLIETALKEGVTVSAIMDHVQYGIKPEEIAAGRLDIGHVTVDS